jgi:hypothetical protein
MNRSIKPGLVPPPRGLEKEEPELTNEEDIPMDDDRATGSGEAADDKDRLRNAERK